MNKIHSTRALRGPLEFAIGTLALAAAVVLTLLLTSAPAWGQEVALQLGTQAPEAALEDLEGNPIQILDFVEAGKPTLIEFWASWCHECEELQPEMDRVHATYGDQVNVLAVAVAVSQSQRRVKRHVEEHGTGFPFLWDGEGEAVRNYKVPGTSVVIMLDGTGKVVYTGSGGSQNLVEAVAQLLRY